MVAGYRLVLNTARGLQAEVDPLRSVLKHITAGREEDNVG
jgi:hypothetical protein